MGFSERIDTTLSCTEYQIVLVFAPYRIYSHTLPLTLRAESQPPVRKLIFETVEKLLAELNNVEIKRPPVYKLIPQTV